MSPIRSSACAPRRPRAGNLKSTPQQTRHDRKARATTSSTSSQPTNPEVVYVPTYNPSWAYGAWPYPAYPPTYYPLAGGSGARLHLGNRHRRGRRDVRRLELGRRHGSYVNVNVNRAVNIDRNFDRTNIGDGGRWQHDVDHRKGVAYRDNATRQQFGQAPPGRRPALTIPRPARANARPGAARRRRWQRPGGAWPKAGQRPAGGAGVGPGVAGGRRRAQRPGGGRRRPMAQHRGAVPEAAAALGRRRSRPAGQSRGPARPRPAENRARWRHAAAAVAAAPVAVAVAVPAVAAAVGLVAVEAAMSRICCGCGGRRCAFGAAFVASRCAAACCGCAGSPRPLNRPSARSLQSFPTPEAAADALTDAIRKNDDKAMTAILGVELARFRAGQRPGRGRGARQVPEGVGREPQARAGGRRQGVRSRSAPPAGCRHADRQGGQRLALRRRGRPQGDPGAPHRPQRARGDPDAARDRRCTARLRRRSIR